MTSTAAITAALALCPKPADRKLPQSLVDAQALADKVKAYPPGPASATDLAADLVNADPDDFDRLLDAAATEYRRRTTIAAMREHGTLGRLVEARLTAAVAEAASEVVTRVTPVFATAVATLHQVAPSLPEGHAATDPAAVLEADAGTEYHQARDALRVLTTIAGVLTPALRSDGTTPLGSQVVTVVDVPEVPVEEIHPFTESRVTPEADLSRIKHVRQLVKDYAADRTQTLLDVVRGKYGPDVTLSLAADRDAVRARLDRVATAHSFRRLKEYDRANERAWARV